MGHLSQLAVLNLAGNYIPHLPVSFVKLKVSSVSVSRLNVFMVFLNLPLWANFVDLTDLSLYYYYLPLDQPTLFYSLNLN